MKTLSVDLGERSYPIYIGSALLAQPHLLTDHIRGDETLIVSNETVAPLYLEQVQRLLRDAGKRVDTIVLPDGEQFKTLDTVNGIFQTLLEKRHSRKTTLIALGGGVVGDMTGFAAACYQRGVNFIQIPTTLLAQVDSSVGGKTGVNHPLGKNMIGAFYQPRAVLADVGFLKTLPDREYSAGVAEVIKYGLISDPAFYEWLDGNLSSLMAKEREAVIYAVEMSCLNKARIVSADEREAGKRAILNLGHTFGHAIETAQGYQGLLHGEAVAVGMLLAAELSHRMGYLNESEVAGLRDLLRRARLPVAVPAEMTPDLFMHHMALDKKVSEGVVRLILLKSIGSAFVSADYDKGLLSETLVAACTRPA
ncbi:MAG: 3-dehydroquinate synthase [Porticoccaceae bacterium]|nr:3-dehydroquinate synthase [Porticoccaceae bacterium]